MTRGGGLSLERLVEFYQAADVHLLASSGEGFGLPTLQAAAAGAVPMACNYSASAELVAGHGEAIAVADWTENEFGIRRALIDVEDAVRRLERLYDDSRELDERSRRARNFALGYDWQRIIADWDVDGRRRRIARIPPSRVVPLAQLGPSLPYGVDRSAVNVRVVERQLGRLESRILADTCDHYSDVRIPVVLADWTASGVRVARRAGYIGLVRADERIALELRALFPAVSGWVAGVEDGQSDTTTAPRGTFEPISNDDPAVLRLHLASSCLVLHVGAMLSDSLLSDAARFGVPCIGGARSVAQRTLWPDLTVETPERALSLARALLTDASFLRGTVAHARATGESMRSCDDTELIAGLRRSSAALIAAETHAAATG